MRTDARPDVVIAGAARSGTSTLAARLASHPLIDQGMVKESNFFSRYYDRGPDWYNSLYAERTPGRLRLDASTSYTNPQFPEALARLAEAAPDAFVIYCVRDPIGRAVSHYQLLHHYFRRDPASTFGAALSASSLYAEVSDYDSWLAQLTEAFPASNVLLVPFDALTTATDAVVGHICAAVGLDPPGQLSVLNRHRNDVVEFRSELVRRSVKAVHLRSNYLVLRRAVGAGRVRRLRAVLTRQPNLPTLEEALASCNAAQLGLLAELHGRAAVAVKSYLETQDQRTGLGWSRFWQPTGTLPASVLPRADT